MGKLANSSSASAANISNQLNDTNKDLDSVITNIKAANSKSNTYHEKIQVIKDNLNTMLEIFNDLDK